ncbi:hypothetical protein GCM10027267_04100 [Paramicrobacterium agarici]
MIESYNFEFCIFVVCEKFARAIRRIVVYHDDPGGRVVLTENGCQSPRELPEAIVSDYDCSDFRIKRLRNEVLNWQ